MNQPGPPKLLVRFFEWYSRSKLQEAILGDLEEQYFEDIDEFGLRKARLRFTWNIFRFLRPGIVRKPKGNQQLNQYGMVQQHFKQTGSYGGKHHKRSDLLEDDAHIAHVVKAMLSFANGHTISSLFGITKM